MPSKPELRKIDILRRDGMHDVAGIMAMAILTREGPDKDGRLFSIIDECAEHSGDVAFGAAMSYSRFNRPYPAKGVVEKLLRRAIETGLPASVTVGHYYLAHYLLKVKKTAAEGIAHLEEAADTGHADAQAEMGEHFYFGNHGLPKRKETALAWLMSSVREGSALGNLNLAKYMLGNESSFIGHDPMELLQFAASEGNREAQSILRSIDPRGDPDEHEPMLPYVVIPTDMTRPVRVREAMMNEFHMPSEPASLIVAALHGFPDWVLLEKAVSDETRAKGKFDEQCTVEERHERRNLQTSVVRNFMDVDDGEAEVMVKLLNPTASAGPCSLKKLGEMIADRGPKFPFDIPPEILGSLLKAARDFIRSNNLNR